MTVLVGRERELDALRKALTTAAGGHGQCVFLEGEAGIGKTRLAREAIAVARELGFHPREGYCDDIASARPFAPFVQALGISQDSTDDDRRAVAALLATDIDDRPEGRLSISGKQFRVTELLGALVEKFAEAQPTLLLIEDLHWADTSTLAALRSVAQRIHLLPVLVLATMRPGYERAELHRAVDAILRDGGTRAVLGPLPPADVATLATELLGDVAPPALLERLEGATGNPLFVTEYVDALDSVAESEGVPVEFRVAVLRRIGQLSEETNDVLRLAAVLGSTFAASDLATVLGVRSAQLTSALQQALQSGVIGERDERLAFRHDLVRDAIYEHIPLDLRRQSHRQVGDALAHAGADPLVVAHHFALAAASYDEDAADWLRRAARDVRLRAPGVAVELLERARELLPPSSSARDALLAELVMPLAWAGRLADAEALGVELLARKPSSEVTGALRCGLVYALTWQGRPKEALSYTVVPDDEALTSDDAVLLGAEAAVAYMNAPDFPAAMAQAVKSEAEARAVGHELALCHALTVRAFATNFLGKWEDAVAICREAIDLADRSKNGEGHLAHPRFFPGMALINLDRVEEAQAVLQRGRQISEEHGLVWALPLYHSHLGASRFIAGDWDAAVAELETCLRIAEEYGTSAGMTSAAATWLAVIQIRRDQIDAAERTVQQTLERVGSEVKGVGLFHVARARLAYAQGDLDQALALLEPGFQAFFKVGAIATDPWTAMALIQMQLKAGNREAARAVADILWEAPSASGVASGRALALRARGLATGDPEVLAHALDDYRTSGRRVDVADTAADLALALIDAGRGEEAQAHIDEARDLYEGLGAARDIAELRAELRARGITRGARRRRARASSGWDSLTETELKVVGLIAQRMSNPEVAERLFVSRHTVESHLKNIYRKLNLSSRVELAHAVAARANLQPASPR